MCIKDLKLFEYYTTGKYKGFLLKETEFLNEKSRRLVFTNGQIEVSAIGRFSEEALLLVFSQIDSYLQMDHSISPVAS